MDSEDIWCRRAAGAQVFIDGHGDVYERGGAFADYLHIRLQPGTLAVLDNYGIQSCLLQRGEPLATLLAASGGRGSMPTMSPPCSSGRNSQGLIPEEAMEAARALNGAPQRTR